MKKYLLILLLIIFTVPSIALASWWNPFTWNWPWTTKAVPQEQVQQTVSGTPIVEEKTPEEKPMVTPSAEKTDRKKVLTLAKPTTPVISIYPIPITTPTTVVTPSTPTVSTPPVPVVELSIDDLSIDEEVNSVRVNWKTNIKSESKVILDGKSYFSILGIGTEHYADIDGLKSDSSYDGTVTAIANNAWINKNFNFTTKPIPLQITIKNKGCSSDNCVLAWETNYTSNGNIKVYGIGSNQLAKNFASSNSKEHCLEFQLTPNTAYTFEINASNNEESAKVTGQLQVPAKLTQTSSGSAVITQVQYECPN
ncbi:MAG: hypothetical protein WCP17_03020 [bacterium]